MEDEGAVKLSQGSAGPVNTALSASALFSVMKKKKKCVPSDQLVEIGGIQNTFGMQINFAGPTEILTCVNI